MTRSIGSPPSHLGQRTGEGARAGLPADVRALWGSRARWMRSGELTRDFLHALSKRCDMKYLVDRSVTSHVTVLIAGDAEAWYERALVGFLGRLRVLIIFGGRRSGGSRRACGSQCHPSPPYTHHRYMYVCVRYSHIIRSRRRPWAVPQAPALASARSALALGLFRATCPRDLCESQSSSSRFYSSV